MKIDRLYYEDVDENGNKHLRLCTTDDIDCLMDEHYECAVGLGLLRNAVKGGPEDAIKKK